MSRSYYKSGNYKFGVDKEVRKHLTKSLRNKVKIDADNFDEQVDIPVIPDGAMYRKLSNSGTEVYEKEPAKNKFKSNKISTKGKRVLSEKEAYVLRKRRELMKAKEDIEKCANDTMLDEYDYENDVDLGEWSNWSEN
jgi:hypothetical protein